MRSPQHAHLGSRIRHARAQAGLSQEACAKAINVGVDTWRGWEQGENIPRADRLQRVADLFDRDSRWFLVDDEPLEKAA